MRVALLAALAIGGCPAFTHAQNAARPEIDRALFLVATKDRDGKWNVRETDRVPLSPRKSCYGWRLHFSANKGDDVAWRAEFALPGGPGKEPSVLRTAKHEKPLGGWIGDSWCVNAGDPVGEHVIKVYVGDSLARTFPFVVVAPADLGVEQPANGAEAPVDPLSMLGDFEGQRAALESELHASYPKPPSGLDTDPAASSVLLVDIDLKGALSRVDGAALVWRGGAGPIRAAALKGGVVMFHALEPGTYSLRFVRVENYNPSEMLVVERPAYLEINVTVGSGISYLGTIVLSRRARLTGLKPTQVELTYDRGRELQAWRAFKQKYGTGAWAGLADQRMAALGSP